MSSTTARAQTHPVSLRNVLIWAAAGLAVVLTILDIVRRASGQPIDENVVVSLAPSLFAVLGALVATRQPGNIVGLLMMVVGVGVAVTSAISAYLTSFDAPPPLPTWLVTGMTFLAGWAWLLLIFPIFHMLLVFPDGKLISSRWRLLVALEVLMLAVFMGATAVSEVIGPLDESGEETIWVMDNPIGFVPNETVESLFGSVWSLGLMILAIGGLTAMIVRFRRARGVEREQIKWLLYAFSLFALVYAGTAMRSGGDFSNWIVNLLFGISILAIPLAMTAAILRYRLFDIDLVIRRTILYVILTGLLGGIYVVSVVLTRGLFGGFANSSFGVAVSTLLVAALFTPLRRRLQKLIDRRLFRTRYDQEQVVQRVASSSREQADLDELSVTLLDAVKETMNPESAGLWVRHT